MKKQFSLLTLVIFSLLLLGGRSRPSLAQSERKPNIIIIFADDLGYGDVQAFYPQTPIKTPRLNQMAAEGIKLTDFHSGAPHCPPARNSLLAGLHTGHTEVRFHGTLSADTPDEPRYIPRILQNAGYTTAMFGKWGMGSYVKQGNAYRANKGLPEKVGFEQFLGFLNHTDAQTYSLPTYPRLPGSGYMHNKLWMINPQGFTVEYPETNIPYVQDLFMEKTLTFIEEHQNEPFFLYLPFTLPHAEHYIPPDAPELKQYLRANGTSIFPEVPFAGDTQYARPQAMPRAVYAAMVSRLDSDVGRILDTLKQLNLDENTLVLFSSDNGPNDGGGLVRTDPNFPYDSSGGLRSEKYSLYEGGIRVPTIAWWPSKIAPASESAEPLGLWDILPTVAEVVGIEKRALPQYDGQSFANLLFNRPSQSPNRPILYWETYTDFFKGQAVRMGNWKAVRIGLGSATNPVYLYNVATDPKEEVPLSPTTNCSLLQQMKRAMNECRAPQLSGDLRFTVVALRIDNCEGQNQATPLPDFGGDSCSFYAPVQVRMIKTNTQGTPFALVWPLLVLSLATGYGIHYCVREKKES